MLFSESSHKRYNLLTGEWLLVSPHRTKRPWKGKVEERLLDARPQYDPNCYLCPGNTRAGGIQNPQYEKPFVFKNDFSALLSDAPKENINEENLLIASGEKGECRVICFSPRHDLTLAEMNSEMIYLVVNEWINQYKELGSIDYINYVQIFENKGDIMGCSNPHPHGQIWANESIPQLPAMEQAKQKEYREEKNSCLLCDYLEIELKKNERIVFENDTFVCLVPFWAVWPYETMILPKDHLKCISDMNNKHILDLSEALRLIAVKYDNLFETSFPYSMGIHQSPTERRKHDEWHFHFHFYPPLLRSAAVKKFMVGYEMLAMPQRDITAEQSAEKLRSLNNIHFKLGD